MKKIRIFLASSITDLKIDRTEVGNFFRKLNDMYIENGIYFELIMCEEVDNSVVLSGKQAQLDEMLCDSELVFFLFFKKVGEYTRHEFELALESYKNRSTPKIVTYFKYVDSIEEVEGEVRAFMDLLDGELHHYYNIYNQIDTLKLGIIMQIKLMKLDGAELTVQNGRILHGTAEIAHTRNIPMFELNKTLSQARERYDAACREFLEKKARFLQSGSDADFIPFSEAATAKEKAEKALFDLEKSILSVAEKTYTAGTRGERLSEKQKQAYRYMEVGQWEKALQILDLREILSELSHNETLADSIRDRLEVNVNEILQRIEVLKALGVDSESAREIISLYEKVYEITLKHGLNPEPLRDYSKFLLDQNHVEATLKVIGKLIYLFEDPDANYSQEVYADLLVRRGMALITAKRYEEAEAALKKAVAVADRLVAEKGDVCAHLSARGRNNIAISYFYRGDYQEEHRWYAEAMEYYERAYRAAPSDDNLAGLSTIYGNMGCSFKNIDEPQEAIPYHEKAIALDQELMARGRYNAKTNLSRKYHNAALCYDDLREEETAEQYYLLALEIREELLQTNPAAIAPSICGTYRSISSFYRRRGRLAEALEYGQKGILVAKRLRSGNVLYAEELRRGYDVLIRAAMHRSQEEVDALRREYIAFLEGLPELSKTDKQEFAEQVSALIGSRDAGYGPEELLRLLCRAFDYYAESGESYLYFTKYICAMVLNVLCTMQGKPELYAHYRQLCRLSERWQ